MSSPATAELNVVNALDIFRMNLPATKWYLGNILHQGAALLSGDPKVGKSFLALQLALAVAGDAESLFGLPVHRHGPVLYLSLDDGSTKRIQGRLRSLVRDERALGNLDFIYEGDWPTIQDGFDAVLDQKLSAKNYELVVLDTLGAVAGEIRRDVYTEQYKEAKKLQALAQKRDLLLLTVHHNNKGIAASPVARASGSHGRTGGVDSVLSLEKTGNGRASLTAVPRDAEESSLILSRGEGGGWEACEAAWGSPPPSEPDLSPERQRALTILATCPQTKADLATALGKSPEATRKLLERLATQGLILRREDQAWEVSPPADLVRPVPVSGLLTIPEMAQEVYLN